MGFISLFPLILFTILTTAITTPTTPPLVSPSFISFINSTLAAFHSPGLAIALISGNQTWAHGFGHASNLTPITPQTLFSAGSTTKSQIALGLSLLVDAGQLNWTTPVSSVLPDFALADEWATSHLTVLDLLSHRTGLPRYDVGVLGRTVGETMARLRHLRVAAEPRVRWLYSNFMYAVAARLLGRAGGTETPGRFLRERVWVPAGMRRTWLSWLEEGGGETLAEEYFWNNDTASYEVVPHLDVSGEEGAGGVISSVEDYVEYLRMMLALAPDGPLSEEGRAAVLGTHMFVAPGVVDDGFFTGPTWYGLGWFGDFVLGELAWHHGGAVGEFRTDMWIFPRQGKGLVLMQNSRSPAINVIAYTAIYELLGTPEAERLPWTEIFANTTAQAEIAIQQCPSMHFPEEVGRPAVAPSWPLAEHVGKYTNPGFVDIDLFLVCNSTSRVSAPDSPARPTRDTRTCFLRTNIINTAAGRVAAELEHVNGNKWVAWAYMADITGYHRPVTCLKVEFEGEGDVTMANFLLRIDDLSAPSEGFTKVD
ncbi:Beta-lactamase/transpeptidase-like protein [Madurella fahalii]|uniref:Beta-lactamase/transpeptidase-like protein n=1 Tax=Madurella fahalii TaxID=1157608 RepID=A0ABQ0GL17_9PEZI